MEVVLLDCVGDIVASCVSVCEGEVLAVRDSVGDTDGVIEQLADKDGERLGLGIEIDRRRQF